MRDMGKGLVSGTEFALPVGCAVEQVVDQCVRRTRHQGLACE